MNVTRRVHLGRERTDCMVELEVDVERLVDILGHKALRNTSKKSSLMSGVIKVKVRPCTVQS